MSGIAAAAGAALGFAVFQTVQRRALRGVDVYRATAAVLAVAACVLLLVSMVTGTFAGLRGAPAAALAACAVAGLVHFGLGWTLLAVSQVRLGAARTGIVVGTVPLFGALVAAVALDEPLGLVEVAGLVVTVAGVAVVAGRRRPRPPADGAGAPAAPSGSGTEARSGLRIGVIAGLATALCWSVSPVLIRYGLRGVESPVAAAAVGMTTCAIAYGIGLTVTGRRGRQPVGEGVRPLLLLSGTAVGLAILLQWTAFDLTRIAVALAVLQLTPPLVVGLSVRVAGDVLAPPARRRAWVGAALTLAGSLALVLAR